MLHFKHNDFKGDREMRVFLTASLLIVMFGYFGFYSSAANGFEGVTTKSAVSEVVTAASGKSVSVKSVCPAGTEVIGGGGECYGLLVTEGWASLAKSAPVQGESSWYVECTNSNTRPGSIQAKAWAICADPDVFNHNRR
jgi:hypothetical protein